MRFVFLFQAEDGIRDLTVTGVQTCALPISRVRGGRGARQSLRTHQRHIDGGRRHQQSLVGTDVGSRLGAADMLLARLQGECEAGVPGGIEGAPDDAPGHLPHVLHARRHEAEVRPAGAQRHAERLTFPDRDIRAAGTPLPGGFERSEEHTSELQSQSNLVCRLLLEKKKEQHGASSPPYPSLSPPSRPDRLCTRRPLPWSVTTSPFSRSTTISFTPRSTSRVTERSSI